MGCGSSTPKPVANNKQPHPAERATEAGQDDQGPDESSNKNQDGQSDQGPDDSNNKNQDGQSDQGSDSRNKTQTSNSQIDIRIETDPSDPRKDEKGTSGEGGGGAAHRATPRGKGPTGAVKSRAGTRALAGYSPRNQAISSRNGDTASKTATPRYQRNLTVSSSRAGLDSSKPGSRQLASRNAPSSRVGRGSGTPGYRPDTKPGSRQFTPRHASVPPRQRPIREAQVGRQRGQARQQASEQTGQQKGKQTDHQASEQTGEQESEQADRQASEQEGEQTDARPGEQGGEHSDEQPDRKRILTESSERLIKQEEGSPRHDGKRRRVNEHTVGSRRGYDATRGGQMGGQNRRLHGQGTAGERGGLQNPGQYEISRERRLPETQGQWVFTDPGADPSFSLPQPIGHDLTTIISKSPTSVGTGVSASRSDVGSEGPGSGKPMAQADASTEARSPSPNESQPSTNDGEGDEREGLTEDSVRSGSQKTNRAESGVSLDREAGEQTDSEGDDIVDNASRSSLSSERTTPADGATLRSPSSSPSKSSQSHEDTESRAEESHNEVYIVASVQNVESSDIPTISTETNLSTKKPKRVKYKSVPRIDDPTERAKQRRIRLRLRDATLGKDLDELDEAIFLFETHELMDNGDLTNALNRLDYLQLRQDLREAIVRRNLGVLQLAITDAYESKQENELGAILTRAEELRDHLQALDKHSHDLLGLDHKLISEIRSYCNPPPSVHEVMAACYMLLGVREERLLEWAEIQSHVGRQGRSGLKSLILNFDPDTVPLDTLLRIKEILNFYKFEDVRVASSGAASFYLWAKNMVELVDQIRGQQNEGGDTERNKSAAKQG